MTTTLAVWDSGYADIREESEGAATHGALVIDARRDSLTADVASGVFTQYAPIDADVLDRHPNWRVLGRYGVGVDVIDLPAASARGVAVFNVPDYCTDEVATHAVALMLSSMRRIVAADSLVRNDRWGEYASLGAIPDPASLTLGLIGLGSIGRETARRAAPFFTSVIAHDPHAPATSGVDLVGMDEVLRRSDVVSLHLPLMPQTHHIVSRDVLAAMKTGAHLVNVSRGGLVDPLALAEALANGHLGGAALDVLDVEPPQADHPLRSAPRVILTNHIAWLSAASEPRLRRSLAQRCAAYIAGAPTHSPINADQLAAFRP